MLLLAPRVIGPLSECSSRVRVQGQLSGSDVKVFADGALVATGTASSANQSFALSGGVSLAPGAMVTATQTVGVETSPTSPEPVEVQARPPQIGQVGFHSQLLVCGRCIWLEGLVPGANVEVSVGGVVRGTGSSEFGDARLGISPAIAVGEILEAQQTACGQGGPVTQGPLPGTATPDEGHGRLPKPKVESPLRACKKGVVVSDVLHGATVTLQRSGGPNLVSCFDASALRFGVNPALVEGETLTAVQEFPDCKTKSSAADPVAVGPAEPIPAPTVASPLCAGGTTVTLSGLEFGALVEILVNGSLLGQAEAPHEGTFDFPVPPLPGNRVVTARQSLCGKWSDLSNAVLIDPAPGALPTPKIPGPLFECAGVVHVENLHPGTRVYVYSQQLGAPIGEAQVYENEADVTVAPLLMKGDEIFAVQRGCGLVSSKSATVVVKDLEELGPPTVVSPLYTCSTSVRVDDLVPGARVDVYVNGVFRGTAASGTDTVGVPITGSLAVGDQVQARQRLCGLVSALGRAVTVSEFLGEWVSVGGEEEAEILAVHAALLHTGKILYFGGDQHTGSLNSGGDVDHTRLFDCDSWNIAGVTGLKPENDLFCSGHALLDDGRLLVGGGTKNWGGGGIHPSSHFIGSRDSFVFDPAVPGWIGAGKLITQRAAEVDPAKDIEDTGGKWYPTLVTLPDCRVMAISGHPMTSDSRHNNHSLELFSRSAMDWAIVGTADYDNIGSTQGRQYEYPRMFVLTDGSVLSSTRMDNGRREKWNPYTDATDWDDVIGGAPESLYDGTSNLYTSAAMLPLLPEEQYRCRILIAGGETPYILDPLAASPTFTAAPRNLSDHPSPGDLNPRRENLDMVILPTGEILVEGGMKNHNDESTGVRKAESFDPSTGDWRVLPAAKVNRNYHSVALLMPDGAVWVAGSNFECNSGLDQRELRIEIFRPWYWCWDRPKITATRNQVCLGDRFEIQSPDADRIERIAIVRCGSCTHNFNPDQRYVGLTFERSKSGILQVSLPSDSRIAIPGYYLLFVIDQNGVPSKGEFIRICKRRFIVDWDHWWWRKLTLILRQRLDPDLDDRELVRVREIMAALARSGPPEPEPRLLQVIDHLAHPHPMLHGVDINDLGERRGDAEGRREGPGAGHDPGEGRHDH